MHLEIILLQINKKNTLNRIHIYIYIHIYTNSYINVYIQTYTKIYTFILNTYTYVYIHTHLFNTNYKCNKIKPFKSIIPYHGIIDIKTFDIRAKL